MPLGCPLHHFRGPRSALGPEWNVSRAEVEELAARAPPPPASPKGHFKFPFGFWFVALSWKGFMI